MLNIKSIPAFRDNYIWIIENSEGSCAVVDPGEAPPVLRYLKETGQKLEAILITHHHNDHIGGISELLRQFPKVNIVGPESEAIPSITHSVKDGDTIELFDHMFSILELKGHTNGHIGYYGSNLLFCGDVLFSAGCGRVFEGTMAEMHSSLNKIKSLPDDTHIYCAHEYTASNIAFALAVDPGNTALLSYRDDVNRLKVRGESTLPTTLKREKAINPFLRVEDPAIIRAVTNRILKVDSISIFTALREWKNNF